MPTKPPTHRPSWWKPNDRKQTDDAYRRRRPQDPEARRRDAIYGSERWKKLRRLQLGREPLCPECRRILKLD